MPSVTCYCMVSSQVPRLTWMSVGGTNPSRAGNFTSKASSSEKVAGTPHMIHIVGFCSMWTMPGSCQNLEKSIQVVARADLAPPPVCPLFQSFCFYWISLYLLSDLWPWVISYLSWHVFSFFLSDFSQSAIGFGARSSFAFVTTSHQLLQGNTAAFEHEFLCFEEMK